MTDVLATFACPLCLETLQKPVRITSCGHNFCQSCLEDLCRSINQANCPTCRRTNAIKKDKIADLARNLLLEEAIEKLTISSPPAKKEPVTQVFSKDTVSQLTDKAEFLMGKQQYSAALDILKSAIAILKSAGDAKQFILALIKKVHCLLMLQKTEEAQSTSDLITAIVAKENFHDENEMEKYYNEIKQIIEKATESQNLKPAFALHHALVYLTRSYRQGIKKLHKFKDVGWMVTNIVTEAHKQNISLKFGPSMEVMLNAMLVINDVDLKEKMKQIAWFLMRFGICCNQTQCYLQAVKYYEQAILLKRVAYGSEANRYQVFGYCHNNLGAAYENMNWLMAAKHMYERAWAAYEHVIDWNDDQQKIETISRASHNLQKVKLKLAKSKIKS